MQKFISFLIIILLAITMVSCATTQKSLMEDSVQSTALNKSRGTFPFMGERLDYEAKFGPTKTVLAEGHIEVGYEQTMDDGTRYIPISGAGMSVALARLIMRIDDSVEAYIHPDTWETLYSHKHMDEKNRDRSFYVWFWPDEMSASVERHYKDRIAKRDYVIPPGTMDSIAWIYEVRQFKFEQGKRYTWYTFDGWTLNRVSIELDGEEDVWTELGFFTCDRLKIYRERSDALPPYGALSGLFIEPSREVEVEEYELATTWFAKDAARTPVKLLINTGIGEFDILLKSITRQ